MKKLRILKYYILYFINPVNAARSVGVEIGKNCRLIGTVTFGSEPYLISIGNHVSISHKTDFITHDGAVWVFREKNPEIDLFAPIKIGNNVFIGMNCTIMPGTIINDNVIIGANSMVKGNIESNSVYAGTPAKKIKSIDEYWDGISEKVDKTKKLTLIEKRKYLEEKFNI